MNEEAIILYDEIKNSIESIATNNTSFEGLVEKIAEKINHLVNQNLNELVHVLYQVDVDENTLKALLLQQPDEDTGRLIARLIVERQLQKIRSRSLNVADENIPEEEKW